jgi:hypothetical protein
MRHLASRRILPHLAAFRRHGQRTGQVFLRCFFIAVPGRRPILLYSWASAGPLCFPLAVRKESTENRPIPPWYAGIHFLSFFSAEETFHIRN